MTFFGPYLTACALLVAGGVLKAVRPGDTARGLSKALGTRVAVTQPLVRAAAAAEAVLGLAAMLRPSGLAAGAVGVTYAAFAVYVLWLRHAGGPLATCGCFGQPDATPTLSHVAVDLALAMSAVTVAVTVDGRSLMDLLGDQPGGGAPLVLASATCAVLAFGVLSHLGRVHGARRLYTEAG